MRCSPGFKAVRGCQSSSALACEMSGQRWIGSSIGNGRSVISEREPVSSMKELLSQEVEMSMVEDRIIERFAEVFEMEIEGATTSVCGSAA